MCTFPIRLAKPHSPIAWLTLASDKLISGTPTYPHIRDRSSSSLWWKYYSTWQFYAISRCSDDGKIFKTSYIEHYIWTIVVCTPTRMLCWCLFPGLRSKITILHQPQPMICRDTCKFFTWFYHPTGKRNKTNFQTISIISSQIVRETNPRTLYIH